MLFLALNKGYAFVIISIAIVVAGGIIIVFVIPSNFKLETGFISEEEANRIVGVNPQQNDFFVLLKFNKTSFSVCDNCPIPFDFVTNNSDPYSRFSYVGGQMVIPCYGQCQWVNQDRYAWNVPTAVATCVSYNFVDAITGKFIAKYSPPCMTY